MKRKKPTKLLDCPRGCGETRVYSVLEIGGRRFYRWLCRCSFGRGAYRTKRYAILAANRRSKG